MTKMVAAALLAASALVPAAAFAQDWHGHREGGGENGGQHARPAQAPAQPAAPAQGRPQPQQQAQVQAQVRAEGGFRGQPQGGFQGYQQRGGNGGFRGAPMGGQGYQQRGIAGGYRGQGDGGGRFAPGGQPQGSAPGVVAQGQAQQGYRQGFDANGRAGPGGQGFRGQQGYADQGYAQRGYQQQGFAQRGYQQQGYRDGGRGYAPYRGGPDRNDGYRDQQRLADRGGWNRGWRQDNRYDWGSYRRSHYGLFNLPQYYAPRGWDYGYRRLSVGFQLDSLFFGQDYWIDNPWDYRLPPAYGEYRWVRYYNDALLVDVETGEVVDTVYGIFY